MATLANDQNGTPSGESGSVHVTFGDAAPVAAMVQNASGASWRLNDHAHAFNRAFSILLVNNAV